MPSSRRTYCRRAAGLLVVAAGCSSRRSGETSANTGEDETTPAADSTDSQSSTTGESLETATQSTTSVVFHDMEAADLPRRARIGVLSSDVWEWVTTAVETGAADVGVEDGWTPTFPSDTGKATATQTPRPADADSRGPRVDLALGAADVLVVDDDPYAIRVVYSGEASYRLKTKPVGSIEKAEPPGTTDTVANVSDLPQSQRRIAQAAVENETGYYVGYLQHEDETYWTYVAHGDNFFVHTTLWADPVDTVAEDAVIFEGEPVDLSDRERELVTTAIESPAATVEAVPETLVDAIETFDALATATGLYVARLR